MPKSKAQKAAKKARKAAKKSLIAMALPSVKLLAKRNPVKQKLRPMLSPVGPGDNIQSSRKGGIRNFMVSGATTRRTQTICEDEYIGEVLATSTGFATSQYMANPGQALTFPWGSKIAALYEEYEFQYLEFYYKREVSEYASLGTTGKVILSFDYDATDSAPTSKQQVEDTVPHMDGMPSTPEIRLKIDCARMRKNPGKYVRPGAQPANTDIKTYDCGNLYVSTYGLEASSGTLGELRVRYCVKLSEPVLEASQVVGGVAHFSSLTATTANNFAGAVLQAGYTPSLGGINLSSAANTVTFPANIPGNYLVNVTLAAGTSVSAIGYVTTTGGVTPLSLFTAAGGRDAAAELSSLAGTTSNVASYLQAVSVTAAGGTLVMGAGTIVTSGTAYLDVWIVSLPASVLTMDVGEDRVAALEKQVQRLMGLLSPPRSASCVTVEEAEEEAKLLGGKSAALPSDELGNSVHIPRGLLTQFMGALSK